MSWINDGVPERVIDPPESAELEWLCDECEWKDTEQCPGYESCDVIDSYDPNDDGDAKCDERRGC